METKQYGRLERWAGLWIKTYKATLETPDFYVHVRRNNGAPLTIEFGALSHGIIFAVYRPFWAGRSR